MQNALGFAGRLRQSEMRGKVRQYLTAKTMIAKKEVKRETGATVRELGKWREVIVTIKPNGEIGFRPKGMRKTEWLTADALYYTAVKARVRVEEKEKKRRRKGNGR